MGINLDMEKVAIVGKCVTENVGIEKIVKNMISNPILRFLIVCGKKSAGHDVGQTLLRLQKNGVDKKMRVIGSTGAIPLLKHLKKTEIERFRKQVTVVDLRGEKNSQKIMMKVNWCLKQNPGKFKGEAMKIKKTKVKKILEIRAKREKEKYIPDPKGSFQIFVDQKRKLIVVEHYDQDFELDFKIVGKTAKEIRDAILKLKLIARFSEDLKHAFYLGEELGKAEWCLINGWEYTQDMEVKKLKVPAFAEASAGKQKSKLKEDEWGW